MSACAALLGARNEPTSRRSSCGLLLGELRQGALEGLMIEAVAAASGAARRPTCAARRWWPAASRPSRRAALRDGAAGLAAFAIQLFQPLAPMLAQPADDIDRRARARAARRRRMEARRRARAGAQVRRRRAHLHAHGQRRDARPRRRSSRTCARCRRRALILDGEAIALTRRRHALAVPGHDAPLRPPAARRRALRAAMPLSVFFFDCLRRDDARPRRRSRRARATRRSRRRLPAALIAPRLVTGDVAAAQAFYDDAIARGHEGVMVKALDAPYEPGARSARGSRSSARTRSTSSCSPPNGATDGGAAGCRTCTSARATRPPAAS